MSLAPPRVRIGLVLVAVLLSALLPGVVAAGRRVAVLEIQGARTPKLQQSIAALLKPKHEVMRASTYRDAARRIRAPRMTPKDIKKVCAYLEIDGVLEGTLSPEAGRYRLMLRLRSGKTGAVEWKQGMWLNAPRLSDKMASGLKSRLVAALDALPPLGKDKGDKAKDVEGEAGEEEVSGAEESLDDEGQPPPPKKLTKAEKAKLAKEEKAAKERAAKEARAEEERLAREDKAARDKTARDKAAKDKAAKELAVKAKDKAAKDKGARDKAARVDDDEPAGDEEEADDGEKPPASDKQASHDGDGEASDDREPADDEAGAGDDEAGAGDDESAEDERTAAAARSAATAPAIVTAGLSFTARRLSFTFSADLADVPPGYEGAPVPGIYLGAEVYPLAFGAEKAGALPRLGIGFEFDRVIKLQSTVDDGMGGMAKLATTQTAYSIDVRYRQPMGKLTVTGLIGFGRLAFKIAKEDAPAGIVVDIPNVKYSSIDPGALVRFQVSDALALLGGARFMFLIGSGQIGNPDQYGLATALGFGAEGGAEYAVTERILIRASGHVQRIGFTFKGEGDLVDRDGDGDDDVGGASDTYFGATVVGGYLF